MGLLLALAILAADPPEEEPMPLGVTAIPPKLKLPERPDPIPCEPDMTTFKPYPTPDSLVGTLTLDILGESWMLRPGFVVSECEFTKILNMQAEHESMKLELSILNGLDDTQRESWKDAERGYQTRIVELEGDLKEAKEEGFWEMWDGPILFGLGVIVTVATVIAAIEMFKVQVQWQTTAAQ